MYNKDKGICKEIGIVIEPILDSFINKFFSNYNFGIPYKHTFFSNYSLVRKQITNEMLYYIVTSKKDKNQDELYNGFNNHPMKELSVLFSTGNDLSFLQKNKDKFIIKEMFVSNLVSKEKYALVAQKRNIIDQINFFYGLKAILDPETEISNFLVHIGKLNDLLYNYSIICDRNFFTDEFNNQILIGLKELKEDENAKLAFDLGFVYLKAMNFALRTEDDYFKQLEFANLDVSRFIYSKEAMKLYCEQNNIFENGKQRYVIERIRNSLMHGNIKFDISAEGSIYFIFVDQHNNRDEIVNIILEELDSFLSQNIFMRAYQ